MNEQEIDTRLAHAQKLLFDAESRGANDTYPEMKAIRELLIPVRVHFNQGALSTMTAVEQKPMVESKLDIMNQAVQQGYTGEFCDQCFGVRMVKSGTCSTCQECGATTGCS
tara:strand:+ start:1802 stop:2134 length:333 start_codon:yes stop_codon:yes gene_type:complete